MGFLVDVWEISGFLREDLTLGKPRGWSTKLRKVKIRDVKQNSQYKRSGTLSPSKKTFPGVHSGNIGISTKVATAQSLFHLLVPGQKGTVQAERTPKEETDIPLLTNGRLLLNVCPSLAGSVYSLIDKERGAEYLLSAFPEKKPYGYQNPWFGGMRFIARKDRRYDRIYEEKFNCERAEKDGEEKSQQI